MEKNEKKASELQLVMKTHDGQFTFNTPEHFSFEWDAEVASSNRGQGEGGDRKRRRVQLDVGLKDVRGIEAAASASDAEPTMVDAVAERDAAFAERDAAIAERDAAIAERESLEGHIIVLQSDVKKLESMVYKTSDDRDDFESKFFEAQKDLCRLRKSHSDAVVENNAATNRLELQLDKEVAECAGIRKFLDKTIAERDALQKRLDGGVKQEKPLSYLSDGEV
ncbi:hypothetical protein C8035_v004660 [Colletotrichum spinosum]|uniref:Uncharacterized protein n=1 Tax=Colletotrichum spinosum TaxID=1347390 RepID=A0A4R8Q117_9PEZI|nr:hypothetical protein C8035_v004660 [Colletotrichum spinosum]